MKKGEWVFLICLFVIISILLVANFAFADPPPNADGDLVPDSDDKCDGTPSSDNINTPTDDTEVDQFGCNCEQKTTTCSSYPGAQCCTTPSDACHLQCGCSGDGTCEAGDTVICNAPLTGPICQTSDGSGGYCSLGTCTKAPAMDLDVKLSGSADAFSDGPINVNSGQAIILIWKPIAGSYAPPGVTFSCTKTNSLGSDISSWNNVITPIITETIGETVQIPTITTPQTITFTIRCDVITSTGTTQGYPDSVEVIVGGEVLPPTVTGPNTYTPQFTSCGQTSNSPSTITFNNKLIMAVKGMDNNLFVNVDSGNGWQGWWRATPEDFILGGSPQFINYQSKLFIFAKNSSNSKGYYRNSSDGLSWSDWTKVNDGTFSAGPAPVEYFSELWLFVRGDDKKLYTTTLKTDGTFENSWIGVTPNIEFGEKILSDARTLDPDVYGMPMPIVAGAQLFVFVTSDGKIRYNSRSLAMDFTTSSIQNDWGNWITFPPEQQVGSAPFAWYNPSKSKYEIYVRGADVYLYNKTLLYLAEGPSGYTVSTDNWGQFKDSNNLPRAIASRPTSLIDLDGKVHYFAQENATNNVIEFISGTSTTWQQECKNALGFISIDVNTSLNKSYKTNPIKFGDVINLTANTTAEDGLSFGQIIVNDTGAKRYFNFSLQGNTKAQFSQNITISCNDGCVINFTARVNDTSNKFKTNDTIVTVGLVPLVEPPPIEPPLLTEIQQALHYVSPSQIYSTGIDGDSIWKIWKWDGSIWNIITGNAVSVLDDFSFAADDNMNAIGSDGLIWHWGDDGWSKVSNSGEIEHAIQFDTSISPYIYGVGKDGNIWRFNEETDTWTQVTDKTKKYSTISQNVDIKDDFHVAQDTSTLVDIYAFGLDNEIYRWIGTPGVDAQWTKAFVSINTTSLPDGEIGVPYKDETGADIILSKSGGVPSSSWDILEDDSVDDDDALPDGLILDHSLSGTAGKISGTPTTAGTFKFTVQVDSGGLKAEKTFSVTITGEEVVTGGWTQLTTDATCKEVLHVIPPSDTNAIAYCLDFNDNNVWKFDGTWTQITTAMDDTVTPPIGIKDAFYFIDEDNIYAIGTDNQIWHWTGTLTATSWTQVTTDATCKEVVHVIPSTDGDPINDVIYCLDFNDNNVWEFEGTPPAWNQITTVIDDQGTTDTSDDIGIKDAFYFNAVNNIYAIGTDNQIWHWTGTLTAPSWTQLTTDADCHESLHVDSLNDVIYCLDQESGNEGDNNVWKFDIATDTWTPITTDIPADFEGIKDEFFFLAEDDIYAIGNDDQIWHWGAVEITVPDGESCTSSSDCQSGNCLDGVCTTTGYLLTTDKDTYDTSETITVTWIAPEGEVNPFDWVAIFKVGDENLDENIIQWFYVSQSPEWSDENPPSAGTLTFDAPDELGDYEFKYFADNPDAQFDLKATSDEITVIEGEEILILPILTFSKTSGGEPEAAFNTGEIIYIRVDNIDEANDEACLEYLYNPSPDSYDPTFCDNDANWNDLSTATSSSWTFDSTGASSSFAAGIHPAGRQFRLHVRDKNDISKSDAESVSVYAIGTQGHETIVTPCVSSASCPIITASKTAGGTSATHYNAITDTLFVRVENLDADNAQGCAEGLYHPTTLVSDTGVCDNNDPASFVDITSSNTDWSFDSATNTWKLRTITLSTNDDIAPIGGQVRIFFKNKDTGDISKGVGWSVYPGTSSDGTKTEVLCGNGVLDTGEECDDDNTVSGDGCSSTCQIEEGETPPTDETPPSGTVTLTMDPDGASGSATPVSSGTVTSNLGFYSATVVDGQPLPDESQFLSSYVAYLIWTSSATSCTLIESIPEHSPAFYPDLTFTPFTFTFLNLPGSGIAKIGIPVKAIIPTGGGSHDATSYISLNPTFTVTCNGVTSNTITATHPPLPAYGEYTTIAQFKANGGKSISSLGDDPSITGDETVRADIKGATQGGGFASHPDIPFVFTDGTAAKLDYDSSNGLSTYYFITNAINAKSCTLPVAAPTVDAVNGFVPLGYTFNYVGESVADLYELATMTLTCNNGAGLTTSDFVSIAPPVDTLASSDIKPQQPPKSNKITAFAVSSNKKTTKIVPTGLVLSAQAQGSSIEDYSLDVVTPTVKVGELIIIDWTAPSSHSTDEESTWDWIGMYYVDEQNNEKYLAAQPVDSGTSGSLAFATDEFDSGTYEFHFIENGYIGPSVAESNPVTVTFEDISVEADQVHMALHHKSATQIYGTALDGDGVWKVWKFNGTTWKAITDDTLNVKDDFHVVSDTDIYSFSTDNDIWHWDGTSWTQLAQKICPITLSEPLPSGTVPASDDTTVTLEWTSIPNAVSYGVRLHDEICDDDCNTDSTKQFEAGFTKCTNSPHYLCENEIPPEITSIDVDVKLGHSYDYWVEPFVPGCPYFNLNGGFSVTTAEPPVLTLSSSPTISTESNIDGKTITKGTKITIEIQGEDTLANLDVWYGGTVPTFGTLQEAPLEVEDSAGNIIQVETDPNGDYHYNDFYDTTSLATGEYTLYISINGIPSNVVGFTVQ